MQAINNVDNPKKSDSTNPITGENMNWVSQPHDTYDIVDNNVDCLCSGDNYRQLYNFILIILLILSAYYLLCNASNINERELTQIDDTMFNITML